MKAGKGIASIISALSGVAIGAVGINKIVNQKIIEKQSRADKYQALFLMMNQWIKIKQEGKSLSDYFVKNGYKKIAVYGMGYAGETFLAEMKESNVEIMYGIDRNASKILFDIEILSLEDCLPDVDVIVVTAVIDFDKVAEDLAKNTNIKVISLKDVLDDILYGI